MDNCPVCGRVILGPQAECKTCGTPLRRTVNASGVNWSEKLTLLLPGLKQLWNGYVIRGIPGLFGSFFLLLWVVNGFNGTADTYALVGNILLWSLVWAGWSLGWYWDSLRLQDSKRPSAGRLVSTIIILMLAANGLMFFMVMSIVLDRS